jgi:hypothetical protein
MLVKKFLIPSVLGLKFYFSDSLYFLDSPEVLVLPGRIKVT